VRSLNCRKPGLMEGGIHPTPDRCAAHPRRARPAAIAGRYCWRRARLTVACLVVGSVAVAVRLSAVFFKGAPTDTDGGFDVEHTPRMYLVNPAGELVAVFYNPPAQDVADTLACLARYPSNPELSEGAKFMQRPGIHALRQSVL